MTGRTKGSPRPPSADDTMQLLEAQIIAGDYADGDRLPSERQLAEAHGISRSGVREVLGRLEERGLIEVRPGLGSFVREMLPTRGSASLEHLVRRGGVTARDVVIARRMLESESAALAAEKRTDAELAHMHKLLMAFDSTTDLRVGAELDVAFHESIVMASGNQALQIMFGAIRDITYAMVLRSLNDGRARHAGAPIHHEVLDAVERRNADDARTAMARHIELAFEYYEYDVDLPLAMVLQNRADMQPDIAELLRGASSALAR